MVMSLTASRFQVGAARNADLMAGYVGDKRKIDELHSCFRERRYEDVIIKFNSLKYPERLSESERKMVELARQRTRASRRSWELRVSKTLPTATSKHPATMRIAPAL
jgi:hypothetical protein